MVLDMELNKLWTHQQPCLRVDFKCNSKDNNYNIQIINKKVSLPWTITLRVMLLLFCTNSGLTWGWRRLVALSKMEAQPTCHRPRAAASTNEKRDLHNSCKEFDNDMKERVSFGADFCYLFLSFSSFVMYPFTLV